jgi:hypothetical protein
MNLRRLGLVVGLAVLCTGCPPTLKPEAMQASIAPLMHRSTGDLLVVVMGATKLSKTKPVQVTDDGFA